MPAPGAGPAENMALDVDEVGANISERLQAPAVAQSGR